MSMKRLIGATGALTFLACILSVSVWVLLNKGYEQGEVEGPEVFVNGVLLTALLFAVPAAWYSFRKLHRGYSLIKSRWIVATLALVICYLFSFIIFAVTLFFAADPFISLANNISQGN